MAKSSAQKAASLLGRLGGSRNTPAQQKARAANRNQHGRPSRYRFLDLGRLQRLDGDRWVDLESPYDAAAKAYLRRRSLCHRCTFVSSDCVCNDEWR